jgi:hypothetical protein
MYTNQKYLQIVTFINAHKNKTIYASLHKNMQLCIFKTCYLGA